MKPVLAEISSFPVGAGVSLGAFVADSMRIIEESGLDYRAGPMGTTVEGEPEEVWALLARVHENMKRHGERVVTTIKIDDRKGAAGCLEGKLASVEQKLGRQIRK